MDSSMSGTYESSLVKRLLAWLVIGVMVWGGCVTLIVATFITNMH